MKSIISAAFTAALLGTALAQTAAPAQTAPKPTPPLKLVMSQALVKAVTEDGKRVEKLLPAPASVVPGAVLVQTVTATNTLELGLGNVIVNLPVPPKTTFLTPMATAKGTTMLYSFDGGKNYGAAPLMKTIAVTENGKTVQRLTEVKPAEYTNVRWVLSTLKAGSSLKLGFRVKVN